MGKNGIWVPCQRTVITVGPEGVHYDFYFYEQDQDKAWACNGLLSTLYKLDLGVWGVTCSANWGGDLTLSVEYKPQADRRAKIQT